MKLVTLLLYFMVFALPLACSKSVSSVKSQRLAWPDKDAEGEDDGMWRTMDDWDGTIAGSGTWRNRMWMLFDGGTVSASDSFIVKESGLKSTIIPAFQPADLGSAVAGDDRQALIDSLLSELKKAYAGVLIDLSIEKPKAPFSILYIGGSNFTKSGNVLGVAPLDLGNFDGEDILFAFPQSFLASRGRTNIALLVHVIAHEIAHSFGARHIENKEALMNPIVLEKADEFSTGPLFKDSGSQDTPTLLRMNVGSAKETKQFNTQEPPEIVELGIISQDNIAQLSIFSLENFAQNPQHNLTDFVYKWDFDGFFAEGPTVRLRFKDNELHTVKVTATNPASGKTAAFQFTVGMVK